jgi:purine-binding chemotaxis protein CheW
MNPTDPEFSPPADQEASRIGDAAATSWDPMAFFGEMPEEVVPPESDEPVAQPTLEVERRKTLEMAPDADAFAETPGETAMEIEFPAEEFAPQFSSVGEAPSVTTPPPDASPVETATETEPPLELPDWDPERDFGASSASSSVVPDALELAPADGAPIAGAMESPTEFPTELPDWAPMEFASAAESEASPVADVGEPPLSANLRTVSIPHRETAPISQVLNTEYGLAARDQADETDESLLSVLATIDAEVAASRSPLDFGRASFEMPSGDDQRTDYMVFMIGGKRYAFAIDGVSEITRSVRTTPVPYAPEWLEGVTNLRGDVLAIIDLRVMFGEAPVLSPDAAYVIVLHGKKWGGVSVGLLVDGIGGMKSVAQREIVTPPAPLADRILRFTRGVYRSGAEFTILLDAEAFLSTSELQQFFPT